MKDTYPNCLYSQSGCSGPCECLYCGFDRKEAERRRSLPMIRSKDGTRRKIVRKRRKSEVNHE